MRAIETVHAEPRDLVDSPGYRINFWQQSPHGNSWNLDAYALTEAKDISEVLHWVDDHAEGRRFEVFAEIDEEPMGSFEDPRRTALVRLLGSDPNAGESYEVVSFGKL